MAKFFYSMQNILNIKYKLEDAAKQEYGEARARLNVEEEKLEQLFQRREGYFKEFQDSVLGVINVTKIDESANAVDILDEMILAQQEVVRQRSKEVEKARLKLAEVMQERKMHEKLKENKFEEFKAELNYAEGKETDEVASYQYNSREREE